MSNSNRNNNNNNNNNNNSQEPFWAWVNSYNPSHSHGAGAGIDHAAVGSGPQFPWAATADGSAAFSATPWGASAGWGPWGPAFGGYEPWGRGGFGQHRHDSRARHRSTQEHEEATEEDKLDSSDAEKSSDTMRDAAAEEHSHDRHHPSHPPPPPFHLGPHPPPPPPPHSPHHPHGPGAGHRGRGRGRGWGWSRGGHGHGRGAHRGRHDGSPPPEYNGPFDFRPLMHAFNHHPFADAIRDYVSQLNGRARTGQTETDNDSFVPPVDTFNTENAYVLHVALPGCSKEDVGVHWDADKGEVKVAGVIYRPGDETFVQGLVTGERRIGMFQRSIKLPPIGVSEKEDIDGFNITAKMENGLLVITIPKVEKEWTEVRKVDIE